MKRFYVFFAVIAMTALLLAGCNRAESQTSTDNPDVAYSESKEPTDAVADDEKGSVAMFDGSWWYRELPADEGLSLDVFCFSGDMVIYYDNNGNEIISASAQDNGDGTFTVLDLDVFGDVECQFVKEDGEWTIITTEDEAVFCMGSPIDSAAVASDYTGKWYKNGNLEEDYVVFNGDGSYGIYMTYGGETIAREEGNWQLKDSLLESGGQQILGDGGFMTTYFNITADGAALWSIDGSDHKYYIKESLIGSAEGDLAKQIVSLYTAEYWKPEIVETGAIYLAFHEDGTLTIQTLTEGGYIEDYANGTWEHKPEDGFTLILDSGEKYAFTLDGDVLTLDDGSVFNRFTFFS